MIKSMKMLTVLVISCIVVSQTAFSLEKVNLYDILENAKEVNTYIADLTDPSGQAGDMLEGIREQLEHALLSRQSANFVMVDDKSKADIIITCDIIERIWLEVDPIDKVWGAGAVAMDVMKNDNYGRIRADITISKGPAGKRLFSRSGARVRRMTVLWDEIVQATITQTIMPEPESKILLQERLADIFIREAFGRRASPLN
jgi:hypothetical protein